MIAEKSSHCLSWERRLQIAIDAAEGQYISIFLRIFLLFWLQKKVRVNHEI